MFGRGRNLLGSANGAPGPTGPTGPAVSVTGSGYVVASAGSIAAAAQPALIGLGTAWGAADGLGTQAMADANQTPASAVYQNGTITTTGALTANRNLTLPTPASGQEYTKTIVNACTGAFSVVVTLASGTTVSVPNGTTKTVFVVAGGVQEKISVLTLNAGAIAAASTDGLVLINPTVATAGVPVQYSRRFRLSGNAYNSVSTLSETQDWIAENRPANVAGATTSSFVLACSLNGAGYLDRMTIATSGTATFAGQLVGTPIISTTSLAANAGAVTSTRASIGAVSSNGLIAQNSSAASGVTTSQWSPRLLWLGAAWNSTGSVSEEHDWIAENRPSANAGTTTSQLVFARQVAAGGFSDVLALLSTGGIKFPTAGSTPPTPAAGSATLWYDGTNFKFINSAGTTKTITAV